jgi:hypothetical protein
LGNENSGTGLLARTNCKGFFNAEISVIKQYRRYAAIANLPMTKKYIFILMLLCSLNLFGQQSDSTSKNKFQHHYISINPVNALFCQQAGISYEFETNDFGVEISTGYFYRTHFFYSKWGIEGIGKNDGSIYPFNGFYIIPQLNLYLIKNNKTDNIYYISIKGVYRNLNCDSTEFHFWHKDNYDDDYWVYRKQKDNLTINGGFVLFCMKHCVKHFFIESYLGPGFLNIKHDMIVAGQNPGSEAYHNDVSNIKPPRHDIINYGNVTFSFGLNLGFRF